MGEKCRIGPVERAVMKPNLFVDRVPQMLLYITKAITWNFPFEKRSLGLKSTYTIHIILLTTETWYCRQIYAHRTSYYITNNTGWPKSCDPNVQAYCGLIIYAMNLNLSEMPSFHQPFEDFTKITQKFVHFLFIFVHFSLFQQLLTNCYF